MHCLTVAELEKLIYQKKIPLDALIELTHACNLKCIHCYCVAENRPLLNLEEIENLLQQLAELGCLSLTFSGGEIFIRKDIFEILEIAKKMHFVIRLFTNGTLVTEQIADKLTEFAPVETELSLYASEAKVHDYITGVPGSFEKTLQAIKLLKKKELEVSIKWILMKNNLLEHQKLVGLARDLGISFRADTLIFPRNDGDKAPLNQRLTDEELVLAYKMLGSTAFNEKPLEVKPQERSMCGAGHATCSISPYGDVYPCVQFFLKFGNIREKSFREIWYDSSAAREWRKLETFADLPVCRSCAMIGDCMRCPALIALEEGSYFYAGRENCRCTRAKIQARKELFCQKEAG
jgi:radical SAM protein with 4Fe4S-binding SPASM domain